MAFFSFLVFIMDHGHVYTLAEDEIRGSMDETCILLLFLNSRVSQAFHVIKLTADEE